MGECLIFTLGVLTDVAGESNLSRGGTIYSARVASRRPDIARFTRKNDEKEVSLRDFCESGTYTFATSARL